jgi:trehalose 2-sulfotransferase
MTTRLMPPPDWTRPDLCYLIAATARSGSTLLACILEQAGVFGRPTEYFNQDWVHSNSGGQRPTLLDCFRYAGQHGRGADGTLGIKVLGHQFHKVAANFEIEAWLPRRRWILLRRRDLLGQAISRVIAKQTGAWNSLEHCRQIPSYDKAAILRVMTIVLKENAALSLYFATRQEELVELFYEDFEHDHSQALHDICAHFGLAPLPEVGKVAVARQRDDVSESWRERFLAEMRDG